MCSPSVGMRSDCWWKGIGKWSMKAGSATNLLSSRMQTGRLLPRRSCDSHGDFGSEAVEFRPESEFLPSTTSYCSITNCRDSRRTYISENPQCSTLGHLDACLFQAGRRKKHGPAVGAPRRPALMQSFYDCTEHQGVAELMIVWPRDEFCCDESTDCCLVHLCTNGDRVYHVNDQGPT